MGGEAGTPPRRCPDARAVDGEKSVPNADWTWRQTAARRLGRAAAILEPLYRDQPANAVLLHVRPQTSLDNFSP